MYYDPLTEDMMKRTYVGAVCDYLGIGEAPLDEIDWVAHNKALQMIDSSSFKKFIWDLNPCREADSPSQASKHHFSPSRIRCFTTKQMLRNTSSRIFLVAPQAER